MEGTSGVRRYGTVIVAKEATMFVHSDPEAFRLRLIIRGYTPARVRTLLAWAFIGGGSQ
jgi:hypothetical protein